MITSMTKDNFRVYKTAELAISGSVLSSYPKLLQPKNCFHITKILQNMPKSAMLYQMALDTSSIDKINQS